MFTNLDVRAIGYSEAEYRAATRYLRRKARRERPTGTWDRAGRFTLDEPTASSVRPPSRAHPLSELRQALSIKHCAGLENADEKATRRLVKLLSISSENLSGHEKLALMKKFMRKAGGAE